MNKKIKIDFPASPEYIASTRMAIAGFVNETHCSVIEIEKIKDLFSQICSLAMATSYSSAADKISLKLNINKQTIDMLIKTKNLDFKIKKDFSKNCS